MTTKKKKTDRLIIEQSEVEPFETDASGPEPAPAESEAAASEVSPQAETVEESPAEESNVVPGTDTASAEDLLEDVRRSLLVEEETKQKEKKSKWWKRIGKGGRKEKEAPQEPQPVIEEIDLPANFAPVEEEAAEKQDEYAEKIDELIDMLEPEPVESTALALPDTEVQTHPQQEEEKVVVDVEELKKQVFGSRPTEEKEEPATDVRSVTLEDGEEVFVEVESKAENPVEERMKAVENVFRPYRRFLYFGAAFLGLVVVAIVSIILFDAYKRSLPPEPTREAPAMPYPTSMSLPGGLNFSLGRGALQNGKWNPRGPEWLEGTEVCRWVAIPWSRQLEAVIRTLTQEDKIELGMSNSDRVVYDVYSITQMSIEEMQELDSNSPCLLLVLAQADSDKRWVVTAIP
jgi:hypothetical protein